MHVAHSKDPEAVKCIKRLGLLIQLAFIADLMAMILLSASLVTSISPYVAGIPFLIMVGLLAACLRPFIQFRSYLKQGKVVKVWKVTEKEYYFLKKWGLPVSDDDLFDLQVVLSARAIEAIDEWRRKMIERPDR